MSTLYEKDFTAWANQQTEYLRKNDFTNLDIEHLLQELQDMGNSNPQAMESHLMIILTHMLKKKYFKVAYPVSGWDISIDNARAYISDIQDNNPSLKNHLQKTLDKCYMKARRTAAKQTNIDIKLFPEPCPWELNEILGE